MHWAIILVLAMFGGNAAEPVGQATVKPAAAQTAQTVPKVLKTALPNTAEDPAAEKEMLELANRSRRDAGLEPLRMDASLTAAAREHALWMVANEHLSHQFSGEASLLERIADVSPLHMDRAGENVAYNASPERAEEALMRSPPHRRNLLDPNFNIAGIVAMWNQGRLYVVQDFAHELAAYSAQQVRSLVAQAVNDVRQSAGLPRLTQLSGHNLDKAVCRLAQQDRMNASALGGTAGGRGVVAYTQGRPEALPTSAVNLLKDQGARQFEVGNCYARSAANPSGLYWVAILLY